MPTLLHHLRQSAPKPAADPRKPRPLRLRRVPRPCLRGCHTHADEGGERTQHQPQRRQDGRRRCSPCVLPPLADGTAWAARPLTLIRSVDRLRRESAHSRKSVAFELIILAISNCCGAAYMRERSVCIGGVLSKLSLRGFSISNPKIASFCAESPSGRPLGVSCSLHAIPSAMHTIALPCTQRNYDACGSALNLANLNELWLRYDACCNALTHVRAL